MSVTLTLLFLLFGMDLGTGPDGAAAVAVRQRCECLQTVDIVPWKLFTDFDVTPENPLCSKVQIVLVLETNDKVCLNPKSKQGQRIQKCWNRIENKPGKKRDCWPVRTKLCNHGAY